MVLTVPGIDTSFVHPGSSSTAEVAVPAMVAEPADAAEAARMHKRIQSMEHIARLAAEKVLALTDSACRQLHAAVSSWKLGSFPSLV